MGEHTMAFERHRRTLEGLAYRMLGTLSDAEDAVQETYLRWQAQDPSTIEIPRAWLMTVCTRICLNQLKVAYRRRETYVGEWLPEPYFHPVDHADPEQQLGQHQSLTVALLHVLETLSPVERAVFLLHDVFGLKFAEVARVVQRPEATCRQSAVRARRRVRADKGRFIATDADHRRLLTQFIAAAKAQDLEGLMALLSEDVAVYSDGGGKVSALPGVLHGGRKAAHFFVGVFSRYHRDGVVIRAERRVFNGSSGLLLFEGDHLATALTIECDGTHIHRIYAVRNPDKLVQAG